MAEPARRQTAAEEAPPYDPRAIERTLVEQRARREARVEQTQARRDQALAGYQRSIESAFREVSDALVNVGESAATEEELWVRLQAARNALDLSNVRYESGYSPYLEVLDAQRTANDAELAFVRNRQARLAFTVDLMKALGGGWKE